MENIQQKNINSAITNSPLKIWKSYASTLVDIFNAPVVYNNERWKNSLLLPHKLDRLNKMYIELKEIVTDEVVNQYNEAEKEFLSERWMPKKMKIIKFNKDKWFGFVKPQYGRNIFFHVSDDQEFIPTKKRIFNPIELKEWDEIFVYWVNEEERWLKVSMWSVNNLMDKKMSEFQNSFEIDKEALQKLASKHFFDKLTDEEILALWPTSIEIWIPIKIRDIELVAECQKSIKLVYDDAWLNLLLKNDEQERKIPINIKQNVVDSKYEITFAIDSLDDFKELKNTIPEPLKGYVIWDSKARYPSEGEQKWEWMKLDKSTSWNVEKTDWKLVLLEDKNTAIVWVDNKSWKLLIKNATLAEFGLCNNEGIYELEVCRLRNCSYRSKEMSYLEYKKQTPKDIKIIEMTLPYYQTFLKEEYTNDFIENLEKNPEIYLIQSQPHMFADATTGEYFSVNDQLDTNIFFDVKEINGRIKYSLIDYNRVKEAITNILKKTDNLKELLIDENASFVEKVMHSYDDLTTVKKYLQPWEGRIRKYEYKTGRFYDIDTISWIYDQQEERVIAKAYTYKTSERTWGHTETLTWDWWRRWMKISVPVKWVDVIKTDYYYPLGEIASLENLAQEIEVQGDTHPIFEKILQDKKLEKKLVQEAWKSNDVLQYKFKKEVETLCNIHVPYELPYKRREKANNELEKIKKASYDDINVNTYDTALDEIKNKINSLLTGDWFKDKYDKKIQEYRDQYKRIIDKLETIETRNEYDGAYDINHIRQNIEHKIENHNYSEYLLEEISELLENLDKQIDYIITSKEFKENVAPIIEKYNIPEYIVDLFDVKSLVEFIENINNLPIDKVDRHILCNCGRARVRDHLIDISWNEDFFCGQDPNDVKYFIADFLENNMEYEEDLSEWEWDNIEWQISSADIEKLKNKRGAS